MYEVKTSVENKHFECELRQTLGSAMKSLTCYCILLSMQSMNWDTARLQQTLFLLQQEVMEIYL